MKNRKAHSQEYLLKRNLQYCIVFLIAAMPSYAQYKLTKHRMPNTYEIPIYKAGSYAEPGRTYVLMNDISSDKSAIFLGKDVTLDLNGYTVKYTDGHYNHIGNGGFEEGLKGWDISKAPHAKVVNTKDVHVFVGDKLLSLQPGDEITSSYVYLPVGNRSYIAMCGITGRHFHDSLMKADIRNEMRVSVFVEDDHGNEVKCLTQYRDSLMVSCPVENKSPRLGGGFVYAHLNHLPAGKYRIRVKAETDCLIDEIDIRPAFDVGIGIVGETYAMGHYDHLYEANFAAFFDYTADAKKGTPISSIPAINGGGSVTIRNGIIENKTIGAISWGIQSTADDVKLILDNVSVKTEGINTTAIDVAQATITNCRFDVKNPFIINRHYSNFYAVDIRGDASSEVSYSSFYGGQGCLVFKGKHSSIHHNYFRNNQSVTNHYSIMAMGDSSRIFDNYIEPERGSGIEIYTHKYIDIFNNTIKIQSSPPTCEYGKEEYSVNAIRIADYRAKPGAPNGAFGNRVYNNKIFIKAINFPYPKEYIPLAWAVFYSASAGDNEIFGNDITIVHTDPASKALATGINISGGTVGFGGKFYDNKITTNVPAAWIGAQYGGAVNSKIYNNTIIKSSNAPTDFKPFRMGFEVCTECSAKNIEFVSNKIVGDSFSVKITGEGHAYTVSWNLKIKVFNKSGKPSVNADIIILDKNKSESMNGKTDSLGNFQAILPEYKIDERGKAIYSPYLIKSGAKAVEVYLNRDTEVSIIINN